MKVLVIQWQLFPSIVLLSSIENPDSRAGLSKVSDVLRRGQDSNLQSSGHEPDESTNSSTPLLPLTLFPPGFPGFACLAGIEPALRLRLGAEVGAPLFPFVHEQSRPLRGRLEKEKKSRAPKQLSRRAPHPNVVVLYLTLPRLLL